MTTLYYVMEASDNGQMPNVCGIATACADENSAKDKAGSIASKGKVAFVLKPILCITPAQPVEVQVEELQ